MTGFNSFQDQMPWIITEPLEVFNRALSLVESPTAASQKKWAWSKTILKEKSLPTEADGMNECYVINIDL